MGGILTNLSSMFIILVNGIILSQDEAGGGRTAHGESEDLCAVREMTYVINTMFHCISPVSHPAMVIAIKVMGAGVST